MWEYDVRSLPALEPPLYSTPGSGEVKKVVRGSDDNDGGDDTKSRGMLCSTISVLSPQTICGF